MNILEKHKNIYFAKVCPYCGSKTKRMSETQIYGKEYKGRDIIACFNYPKCDAFVGCDDWKKPLGRLANKQLRKAKIEAHKSFDKLWKENIISRNKLYSKLSEHLNIPKEFTHIGMFNIKTCKEVKKWADEIYSYL